MLKSSIIIVELIKFMTECASQNDGFTSRWWEWQGKYNGEVGIASEGWMNQHFGARVPDDIESSRWLGIRYLLIW